jgi:uncharacterized protein involved in outer membrane biogenesis
MCSVRKVIQIVLWTVAVVVLIAGVLFVYLRNADLSVYEDQIEALVSDAIGHDFEVAGRFELHFGGVTRLLAEDVSLRNPDWPSDPDLVRIGRVSIAIDTFSLFSGPLVIEELDVRDVEGRLEVSADRRANWTPAVATWEHSDGGGFDLDRIAFRRVSIESVGFSYLDAQRPRPLRLEITSLGVAPDTNDILDLDLHGTINGLALWADGKLGPWQNFLDGRDITADLDLTLGAVRLSVSGSAEDLPYLQGISLQADLIGPDVGRLIDRLGLPPFASGPFEIEAQIAKLDGGHRVRAEGNLGAIDVLASGTVDRFIGTERAELDFSIAGPDTKYVAELFGVKGAPAEAFRMAGEFVLAGDTANFSDTRLSIGANSISVDGSLQPGDGFPDGQLTIEAEGPDFSVLGPFIDVAGLPKQSFDVLGNLHKQGNAIRVQGLDARVGSNRIRADGSLTVGRREDSEISLRAEGPDISVLQDFTELKGLPPSSFAVTARIKSHPTGIAIQEAVGVFGDHRVQADGVVTSNRGLVGTSLQVLMQGPELQDIALLTGIPYLPAGPFDISANLRFETDLLVFEGGEIIVGNVNATASGKAGLGQRSGYLDISAAIEGPDASQFSAIDWLQPLAMDPFSVRGRLETTAQAFDLTSVEAAFGDYRFSADGALSVDPMSNDSDLAFAFEGPSLHRLGEMFGTDMLVDKPFSSSGQFTGAPTGFVVENFVARVGDEDLNGQFAADLTGKPRITGKLASTYLDLSERLQSLVETEADADAEESGVDGRLFSDAPIDTKLMQTADIDIDLQIDRLRTNTMDVSDFRVAARLLDGELAVDPIHMVEGAGRLDGKIRFAPIANGYEVEAELAADQLHLGLAANEAQERSTLPPLSGTIRFQGAGGSVREIMASADGRVSLRQGAGQVKEFVAAVLFSDVVLEALRTINPMRKKETSRKLDCGIYEIDIADGLANLERAAMQTDRLLIVATGNIDLATEKLNVNFRAKSREGLGVSLGSVANSFLGVRGTLGSPRITIDPKGTVTTTGAAVATGGLSLLARSMWDRLSAEKSICAKDPDAK